MVGVIALCFSRSIARRDKEAAQILLAIPLVTSAIISSIYFVGTRFRTPVDGLVIIWASFGLIHLYGRWKSRSGDISV